MGLIIQSRLKEAMEKYSSNPYIRQGNEFITYNQIEDKANKVEHWLSNYPEMTKVGVMIEKTSDFISSLIGILYARCIFVPFMSSLPEKRMVSMNQVAEIDCLITDQQSLEKAKEVFREFPGLEILVINELERYTSEFNRKHNWDEEDATYIYFTSGTTGKPKAILGKNKSITQFIDWETKEFNIDQKVVTSQITSVGFDASLRDFFIPLFNGGMVCCPENKETILETGQFKAYINANQITMIHCTPSVFKLLLVDISKKDFEKLKYIMLAGEAIHIADAIKWYEVFGERIKLVNFYGASETTMIKAFHVIEQEDFNLPRIPAGKAIDGAKILVLNGRMRPCSVGSEGEVYIRTPYCSLGYYNNEKLTHEKFIVNPYTGDENDLLYRTGDIGKKLPNGEIEILGRTDRMVKIHGTRIELDEIETIANQIDGVKKAAVVCQSNNNTTNLVLYFVEGKDKCIGEEQVRGTLEKLLPSYSLPHFIQKIENIPLNSNGKTEYKVLESYEIGMSVHKEPPATKTEKAVLEIWKKHLNKDEMGVLDNFFSLGGHSLNIMAIVNNINREFHIDLPIKFVFEQPTIRKIASYIDSVEQVKSDSILPTEEKEYYRMTYAQQRMYALQQFEPESPFYVIVKRFIVEGKLDYSKVLNTLEILMERHYILRTEIMENENGLVQKQVKKVDIPLIHLQAKDEEEACELLDSQEKNFVLHKAPLFRIYMVTLSKGEHVLEFQIHHIISDGISMNLLVREFCLIYSEADLPKMELQYKDYAEWEGSEAFQKRIRSQEEYWLEEYKEGVPTLNMPVDFAKGNLGEHKGNTLHFPIEDSLLEKIAQLQQKTGCSKYCIMVSAFAILMSRYSGQDKVVIGMPVSGRKNKEFEDIMGLFVNTVAVKFKLEGMQTYLEYLKYVWNKMIGAMDNQEYPFEQLVEKLNVERIPGHNLMFDVMMSANEVNIDELSGGDLIIRECNDKMDISKFMLTFTLLTRKENDEILIEYESGLFRRDSIIRMWECFKHILEQICQNPMEKLSQICIISDKEKRQIVDDFNNTYRDFDFGLTPVDLFEKQVEEYPNRKAVCYKESCMTYLELNEQANKLADQLVNKGVRTGDRVGILSERSVWMMVAVLGVLKAGAVYIPIDSTYPESRIQYMIENASMRLMLIQDSLVGFDYIQIPRISYGETNHLDGETDNRNIKVSDDSMVYQIYTSGSTGKPKGVMVSTRNLMNTIYGWREEYKLEQIQLKLLQLASFSFDVFTGDWCKALLNGGTMYICPEEERLDVDYLKNYIQNNEISYFETTPGVLFNLMDYIYDCQEDIPSVKMITVGSDTCNYEEFQKLYRRYEKNIEIRNSYGLTESTVDGTFYMAGTSDYAIESVPIGKPMANYEFYIVDKYENLQPIGVYGELYVAGEGVTQGYCGRDDLTSEKYITSTWDGVKKRMYKTGDLARWLPDGNIEFAGRIDNQIKLNGFRIETGEIENCLSKNEMVKECAVLCSQGVSGQVLCAFVALKQEVAVQELKEYVGHRLPNYMVPRVVIILDKMPLTHNGKIDRKQLQEISIDQDNCVLYEEPKGKQEKLMADIWMQVTGGKHIGRNDEFMDIGGDSIKLIKVLYLLRKNGYEVSPRDFYQNMQLKIVSALIKEVTVEKQKEYHGVLKLMPVQHEFFVNPSVNKNHWNQAVMVKLKEYCTEETLKQIISEMIRKHSMFRTTFEENNGDWHAVVHRDGDKCWKLTKVKLSDTNEESLTKVADSIQKSLNYCEGPVMHIGLLESKNSQFVFVCVHHLVIDTVSWRILLDDLDELFSQDQAADELNLCPEVSLYKERIEDVYEFAESNAVKLSLEYWKREDKIKCDNLPVQDVNLIRKGINRRKQRLLLSEEQTKKIIRKTSYTVQDKLLAVLCKSLYCWGGLNTVRISMENNGRHLLQRDLDLSRTVGWFTAEYPLVFKKLDEDISSVCEHVQRVVKETPDNGISYGVLKNLKPECIDLINEAPICFNYHGEFDGDVQSEYFEVQNIEVGKMVDDQYQTPYSLSVQIMVIEGKMQIDFVYDKNEFLEEQIESLRGEMSRQIERLL